MLNRMYYYQDQQRSWEVKIKLLIVCRVHVTGALQPIRFCSSYISYFHMSEASLNLVVFFKYIPWGIEHIIAVIITDVNNRKGKVLLRKRSE